MHLTYISIFPEIFESFTETSLIKKACDKGVLAFTVIDPRDFCYDKQKQVDDEIYGGWAGLLIKAQPIIDAVKLAVQRVSERSLQEGRERTYRILFVSPAQEVFAQNRAHNLSEVDELIFVCGRYEWIDYRFELRAKEVFGEHFLKISLWKFVTLGGELPAMTMTEAIVRLLPDVIKEEQSRKDESYSTEMDMDNLEYPQYTRPDEVEGYGVPEVLLSWNHAQIAARRKAHIQHLSDV